MLVGEENVGKTSLTRFLLSNALIDSAVPNVSTNGISISDWTGTNELQRLWHAFCPMCFEYLGRRGHVFGRYASGVVFMLRVCVSSRHLYVQVNRDTLVVIVLID